MLTATYSLVALSVEQQKACGTLSALRQYIKNSSRELKDADSTCLESAVDKLSEFDQYCHQRKVEVYVIPAIRKATREADCLLAELESLSAMGFSILRSVRDRLRMAFEQGAVKIEELCSSMELYCNNLYQRLVKEEELLQIAQRVISLEEWFAIAASFLSHDAAKDKRKRYACNTGPRLLPPPASTACL
jgi:hemerythrin-like domain-containing protein